jgi:hypothetical protein
MRIRIAELLCVVAVFAFATVSLSRADELFEILFFNFTLVVIFFSLVMAIGRSKNARAFWTGFFAASSLYLGFAQLPDYFNYSPRYEAPEFTTKLLRWAGQELHPVAFDPETGSLSGGGVFSIQGKSDTPLGDSMEDPFLSSPGFEPKLSINIQGGQTVVTQQSGQAMVPLADPLLFMQIGHAAWALLFGWIAGHLSRIVYERSRKSR